jgi:hypothetical protein
MTPQSALAVLRILPLDLTLRTSDGPVSFNSYILAQFSPHIVDTTREFALPIGSAGIRPFAKLLAGDPVEFQPQLWALYRAFIEQMRVECLPAWFSQPPSEPFRCQVSGDSLIRVFCAHPKPFVIRTKGGVAHPVNFFGILCSRGLAEVPLVGSVVLDIDEADFGQFGELLDFGRVVVTDENRARLTRVAAYLGMRDGLEDVLSQPVMAGQSERRLPPAVVGPGANRRDQEEEEEEEEPVENTPRI